MADNSPRLDSLFLAALEIESPKDRAAFLNESCGDDRELRSELERLLAAQSQIGSFLESPPSEFDATIISTALEQDRMSSLQAGLAATFDEGAAVVIGNAGHSVLKSLERSVNVPRIMLRESATEGADPIARPKSSEIPNAGSDSRYQLQGEIARGGMGAILKGRDTDLGRDLAIKVLLDAHKDKPEVIQRFVEEAQIGGQLQHPGVVPIYELGQFSDQRPFFAMKLVKGETLSKLLTTRKEPAEERGRFLGIFVQVCQTMAYAHSRGVIHRDLKPANIMVGAFGEVQVMDWGLAKVLSAGGIADEKTAHIKQKEVSVIQTMRSQVGSDIPGTVGTLGSQTQMGSVMGTPAYMPPEQALGEVDQMDERADVFGLGAILCEILTGKPPYVAEDGTQVFRMASRGKLEDCIARLEQCDADAELVLLVKRCLELEPADRLRDAGILAHRMTEYLESVETKLRQTELERVDAQARAEEFGRRRNLLYVVAVIMLIGFVATGFAATYFRSLERTQRTLAEENEQLALDREAERNAAVTAREREAKQRQIAQDAQRNEATLRALAEDREQTIRATLYAAEMNLAGQAAERTSGIRRVLELTSRWRADVPPESLSEEPFGSTSRTAPVEMAGALPDLRGWEWYYLWSLCHQARLSLQPGANSVDCCPDGRHFATAIGDQVSIWDAQSGELQMRFGAGPGYLSFLAYNPDGTKIAVGGYGRPVGIYETGTGTLLTTVSGDDADAEVRTLSWSPDGQRLAIAIWDEAKHEGEISLWDTQTSERIQSIPALPTLGFSDWNPDGTRLLFNGYLYDTESLEVVTGSDASLPLVGSSQFNPQGDLFAIATFNDIEIRSAENSQIRMRLTGHRDMVRSIRWNPDGKLLASAAHDDTVRIWDIESAREVATLRGHTNSVVDVQWSIDGKQLVSADSETIKLWDCETLSQVSLPQSGASLIRTLLWDSEGQVLVAGGASGLHLYDAESGQVLAHSAAEDAECWCQFHPTIAWSSTGKTIAVVHRDEILLLDDHSLQQRLSWKLPDFSGTIALSPDGSKLAVTSGRGLPAVTVYDASNGNDLTTINCDSVTVSSLCWSPDSSRLACGGGGHGVVVDGMTGTVLCQLLPEHSTGWMNSVAWSPAGDRIAAGCAKQMIVVFDAATGATRQTLLGHTSGVECVVWNPVETRLASCGEDGSVRIWNPDGGVLLLTLNGHGTSVRSVAWSPDGVRLASASDDGDVRIWDAQAGYRNATSPLILETLSRCLDEHPNRIEDLRLCSNVIGKLGILEAAPRDGEPMAEVLHCLSTPDTHGQQIIEER